MPINKKDYPENWAAISLQVREAAGQKCQWCGAPNGRWVRRVRTSSYRAITYADTHIKQVPWLDFQTAPIAEPTKAEAAQYKRQNYTKIVLTVAHLDRDRTNNAADNLAALCQRCHLNHDRIAQHLPHRRYGRAHDRPHQKKLFE